MKVKFNQKLHGVDGLPLKADKGRDLTLRDVSISSVLGPAGNRPEDDTDEKKYHRFELYKKIKDNKDEVDLTTTEIAEIKKAIGKHQPALIMGQCWDYLENKT